jgi:predicted solute-binding protein
MMAFGAGQASAIPRPSGKASLRYALISFLNARPLWWGLTHHPEPGEEFQFASPARCANLIAGGDAALALIPAIEMVRIPGVVALPKICIASQTEVRSVLLVSKVPLEAVRSVALDPSSRTSVTLARILIGERFGPEHYRKVLFDPVEAAELLRLEGHDAAVVIGDRALQVSRELPASAKHRYDLVSEWNALYGEPFVFALWAGSRAVIDAGLGGKSPEELVARLVASREQGLSQVETIAREASGELALPLGELVEYFRSALHYDFGSRERSALARFYALAAKYRLIDEGRRIKWLIEPK